MTPHHHNKNQQHPEDTRNMIIFFVIAALLYVAYNHFILTPQRAAIEARQAQQKEIAMQAGVSPENVASIINRQEALNKIAPADERISINTPEISGSLSLIGGRIDDISLNKHFTTIDKTEKQPVLHPAGMAFSRYIDYGWVSQDIAIPLPNAETPWRVLGNKALTPQTPVTLFWDNGQGLYFERVMTIDEHSMMTVTQSVKNTSGKMITLYPFGLVGQTGIPDDFQGRYMSHEGPVGYIGKELEEIGYKTLRKEGAKIVSAQTGWAGISDKYWLAAFIPSQEQNAKYTFKYMADSNPQNKAGKYQVDFVGAPVSIQPGQTIESKSHLFVGAKEFMALKKYAREIGVKNFDLAVDFGWYWFLTTPFFYILHFFYTFTGNMGIAIILLTILIRSAVFPLTNTSYKSFAKMKKASPKISELREKYGDDKTVLQQKIMEYYQKEGVNPMAGCVPILLQIPIFFALYKTLFVTIEMRHAPFFGWIKDLSAPDPTSIFNLFGLINWTPPDFLMIGFWPCLMMIGMIIQRNMNPPPQDPIQRDVAKYYPFMITFLMAHFAVGLVIYWTFSAFIGIAQQIIIMRNMGMPIYLFGEHKEEDQKKTDEDIIDEKPKKQALPKMVDEPIKDISAPKPRKKKKKK